jgi:hypothetical protein
MGPYFLDMVLKLYQRGVTIQTVSSFSEAAKIYYIPLNTIILIKQTNNELYFETHKNHNFVSKYKSEQEAKQKFHTLLKQCEKLGNTAQDNLKPTIRWDQPVPDMLTELK